MSTTPTSASSSAPLRLAELVASLSLATDLGTGQPMEHALRVCRLALELASSLGLNERECGDVYYIALLRAIGCVSDAHRVAARFGDEMLANAQISLMDTAQPGDVLNLLLRHAGEGQPALRRARMIVAALAAGPGERNQIITAHCEVAEQLARRLGMRDEVALGVTQVYERWDGKGAPGWVSGEAILQAARVVIVARDAELFYRLDGLDGATYVIRKRLGTLYDPILGEHFCRQATSLLRVLDAETAWDAVLAAEPGPPLVLTPSARETAMRAIADFVDLKSPYTAGHSSGVARLAASAGEQLGLAEPEITTLRQAGYVHDIGRVGVSTAIWDKPGALSISEWERVRLHPYLSERVLGRPAALTRLASIAALHHERLDGSGYYRGIPASMLSLPARVLAAADVYHALTERRPHRPAYTSDAAATQLQAEARAGRLDPSAVNAVLAAAGHRIALIKREWPAGLSDREVEVLRLLALGLANREMGHRLSIAEKTVGHHIQHIYTKIGVSTRAAATLFALQHDLLADVDPA
ncbi:MAG TPA: HD domain-containing phosphohydrolase [Ktedonobacterales bacterium]|nr:HD domain-containing phosphohydrolase [Ktedonobacterales bacterium]